MNTYELKKLQVDMQSIEVLGNQVDDTFDTVDSLNDVKDIIDSQKDVLTIPALEAVFKNINRLYDKLGVSKRKIAVESHSIKTNYNLANESVLATIGSAIAAIWQALVSMFKKIGQFFASLFGMSKKGSDDAQKIVEYALNVDKEKLRPIKKDGPVEIKKEIIIISDEEINKSEKHVATKPEPTLGALLLNRKKLISMYTESGRTDYSTLLASLHALHKGIDDTHKLSMYLFYICDVEIADRIMYPHDKREKFVKEFEVDFAEYLSDFGPAVYDPNSESKNLYTVTFGSDWPGLNEYTIYAFDKAEGEDAFHYLRNFSLVARKSKQYDKLQQEGQQHVSPLTTDQVKTLATEVKKCFDKIEEVTNLEREKVKNASSTCEDLNNFFKDSKAEGQEKKINESMARAYRSASNFSAGGGAHMYINSMHALKAFNVYCESHLDLYE